MVSRSGASLDLTLHLQETPHRLTPNGHVSMSQIRTKAHSWHPAAASVLSSRHDQTKKTASRGFPTANQLWWLKPMVRRTFFLLLVACQATVKAGLLGHHTAEAEGNAARVAPPKDILQMTYFWSASGSGSGLLQAAKFPPEGKSALLRF